jgi:Tetratricopeptide repeat
MATPNELQQRTIEYAKTGMFGTPALDANLELTRAAPANEGGWTRLARCYMEAGRLDEATAALDAVLQLNPQNSIARSLQIEVTKRRIGATAAVKAPPARAAKAKPVRAARGAGTSSGAPTAVFGRTEFTALGQMAPDGAMEIVGSRLEALLMAVNERPFAQQIVEARNRAGHSGARLYRRNSMYSGGAGHIYAFQHGGRWEPQVNVGLFAATNPSGGRDCLRAGIGFNLTRDGSDRNREEGQARVLAHFAHFQQLVSAEWGGFLASWLASNGAFVQYGGGQPPATDLSPGEAIARLLDCPDPAETAWVFCGRWLFADTPEDAATLADARKLLGWIDRALTDLQPLWTSVYRAPVA